MTTVNGSELLCWPATVTTTGPDVAPVGTGVAIDVSDQVVGIAATPLNVTVLEPCVLPKFVPAVVIGSPTAPVGGVSDESVGGGGCGAVIVESVPAADCAFDAEMDADAARFLRDCGSAPISRTWRLPLS